jgi:hypothetical protein
MAAKKKLKKGKKMVQNKSLSLKLKLSSNA